MKLKPSKAFTLVEMLIVLIIIGILAGLVMITTAKAIDKAEAAKIVNNLRVLKSAALMYYADNGGWPVGTQSGQPAQVLLQKYVDAAAVGITNNDSKKNVGYFLVMQNAEGYADDEKKYAVKYQGSVLIKYINPDLPQGVRDALALVAAQDNLWNSSWFLDDSSNTKPGDKFYNFRYYNANGTSGNSIHYPVYIVYNGSAK